MGAFAKTLYPYLKAITGDIYKLCQALNFNPTWQQRQLFDAVQRREKAIACKSGQGPGKTTASVVVGLFRTLQAVDALTVVTAPTMRQCKDVWLVEAGRLLEKADETLKRFITLTKTRLYVAGRDNWGVQLVTASREENAQGYHEPNMTIIVEEASGVPREIITQFKGTLSNPNALMLLIGNPNTRDCSFFDSFTLQRSEWHCLTWNAEETPESEWFSHDRNRKLEREFGRDSDVYRIRVMGEFPFTDPNCVISAEMLERCTDKKDIYKQVLARPDVKQISLDFARYGGDENTVYRRSGNAIVEWNRWAHIDPSLAVRHAFRMQTEAHWRDDETWYVGDAGGMGQGIMHLFHDAEKRIYEFHNGSSASDSQYENKITEAWFTFAQKIKAGNCYLPRDPLALQQLSTRQYFTTKKGKLILETKDEYMKRGNISPDRGDGIVMAFYDELEATGQIAFGGKSAKDIGTKVRAGMR